MSRTFWLASVVFGGVLIAGVFARAQDPVKDDALDKLLEKLDKPKDAGTSKSGDSSTGEEGDHKDGAKKQAADEKGRAGDKDAQTAGDEPADNDLDSLLEKLGESDDSPTAKGKPQPGSEGQRPSAPGEDATGGLKGQTKDLDEHLEELTGRKKKKRDQQNSQQSQDDGSPLGEAIKKMDEVEKRLSKTDTGQTTRKTQEQIVKQLDTILEQLRQSSSQSRSRSMSRRIQQAGNKPGSTPGQEQNQGNNAAGVGPSKSLRPNVKSSLANNKDTWGDLPPHLREEMENVFKEEMLPAKRLLIERYYMSLSKKSRAQE